MHEESNGLSILFTSYIVVPMVAPVTSFMTSTLSDTSRISLMFSINSIPSFISFDFFYIMDLAPHDGDIFTSSSVSTSPDNVDVPIGNELHVYTESLVGSSHI